MKTTTLIITVLKSLVITSAILGSSALAEGETLYKQCASCHGVNAEKAALGKSKIIANMSESELMTAMNGYKDGSYGGDLKGLMKGQVIRFSSADISSLAKYISSLSKDSGKFVDISDDILDSSVSTDAATLYKRCSACHGVNGEKVALGKSKIIANMSLTDLNTSMNGYKDGTYGGEMQGLMKGQVAALSPSEIYALSEYITSLSKDIVSVPRLKAKEHLATHGVSMKGAQAFIMGNLNNLSFVFNVCKDFGVNNDMIAEILEEDFPGLTGNVVSSYFDSHELIGSQLDFLAPAGNDDTKD
mgnify:CR=1 FL=1